MPDNQTRDKAGEALMAKILATFVSPEPAAAAEFRELIEKQAGPIYGTSPDHPGKIVEMRPDGSRILGSSRGRQFIPD